MQQEEPPDSYPNFEETLRQVASFEPNFNNSNRTEEEKNQVQSSSPSSPEKELETSAENCVQGHLENSDEKGDENAPRNDCVDTDASNLKVSMHRLNSEVLKSYLDSIRVSETSCEAASVTVRYYLLWLEMDELKRLHNESIKSGRRPVETRCLRFSREPVPKSSFKASPVHIRLRPKNAQLDRFCTWERDYDEKGGVETCCYNVSSGDDDDDCDWTQFDCGDCQYVCGELSKLKTHYRLRHSREPPRNIQRPVSIKIEPKQEDVEEIVANDAGGGEVDALEWPCDAVLKLKAEDDDDEEEEVEEEVKQHNNDFVDEFEDFGDLNQFDDTYEEEDIEDDEQDDNYMPAAEKKKALKAKKPPKKPSRAKKKETDEDRFDAFDQSNSDNSPSKSARGPKLFCTECDAMFYSQIAKKKHMRTHTHPEEFEKVKCNYCDVEVRKKHLDSHMYSKHKDVKMHMCEHCSYRTSNPAWLTIHINNMHLGISEFRCEACKSQFSTSHSLKKHIDRVHNRKRNALCEQCSYQAFTQFELRQHISAQHAGNKLKCEYCKFSTSLKHNLVKHVRRVHTNEKNYSCNICSYRCAEPGDVGKHYNRVHLGMRRYECSIPGCSFKTDSKGNWLGHLARDHGFTQDQILDHEQKRLIGCRKGRKRKYNYNPNAQLQEQQQHVQQQQLQYQQLQQQLLQQDQLPH